ncbi:MAG: hypothetical protein HPY76_08115 [Anaerolineae bacterium]|nr:hypothetical protein [Anaerolineae bacterium]
MFQGFKNSWELAKASARVLAADKELMVFPIISSVLALIISATFLVPMFAANLFDTFFIQNGQVLGYVALFLFYLVQYVAIFFCNTALVGAAMIRLEGGDPTVGDGFRIAFSRLTPILGYAAIAATVGMLLQLARDKSKGLGRFVISLLGFAWNIATYLVVPVLAVENVGPIEAIKRSVAYLRKTWGEQIIGNFGLGALFGVITFVLFLVMLPLIFVAFFSLESVALGITLSVVFVLLLVLVSLVQSTLNGIYTAAVYQYARDGKVGEFFDANMVRNAFRVQA